MLVLNGAHECKIKQCQWRSAGYWVDDGQILKGIKDLYKKEML